MKKFRMMGMGVFFVCCIVHNIFWLEAEGKSESDFVLTTQEVEDEIPLLKEETVVPMGISIYYHEAKGWIFNDVIYMDGCATYQSSYGGTPSGMLTPGYYRFVKSNGSYVALCAVDLVRDGTVRSEYADLWEKYGGMWSWEQAFYNQLDGTPELKNPTDIKKVQLENGKVVMDQTQNYRFIKCWIKIEDLRPNPNPVKDSYKQTVRYFIRDPRTGEETEVLDLKSVTEAEEETEFFVDIAQKEGFFTKEIRVNGTKKEEKDLSYTVLQENEICIYLEPYKALLRFHANEGSGKVEEVMCFFPEESLTLSSVFSMDTATFLGWSISEADKEAIYCDGDELIFDLKNSDVIMDLYAVWDFPPEVVLPDLYFSKVDLLRKKDIGRYIFSYCKMSDAEDVAGEIQATENVIFQTDLKAEICNITEGWVTYCVHVYDSVGNCTEKWGRFYVMEVWPERLGDEKKSLRFIGEEYLDLLPEDSIWVTDSDYHGILEQCLQKETGIRWKKTPYGWQIQM